MNTVKPYFKESHRWSEQIIESVVRSVIRSEKSGLEKKASKIINKRQLFIQQ